MKSSSVPGSRRRTCWGFIHYNSEVIDADRQGRSPYDVSPRATEEIRKTRDLVLKIYSVFMEVKL